MMELAHGLFHFVLRSIYLEVKILNLDMLSFFVN